MAEGVVRDGKALMFNRQGQRVAVPVESLDQALSQGFAYESADSVRQYDLQSEAKGLGGKLKTAGEAALRGATVGLSDVALTEALGDDYREAAAARQAANPMLSTGAEVIGGLAPILASGGTSAAARGVAALGAPARGVAALGRGAEGIAAASLKALGATGETALGRVGARALSLGVSGGVEGAVYGAGKAVSDAALGGTDITAEKLLAGAEEGALFGAVGGGLLGGLGQGVGEAGKAAVSAMTGGKTLAQAARDFAERRAVKSVTGNYKKAYDEITRFGKQPERLQNLGRKLIERKINIDDLDDAITGLSREVDDAGQRMTAVAKELDDAGVTADARKLLERWDEQVEKLRSVDLEDYQKVAAELESKVAPLRRRVDGAGDMGVVNVKRGADGKRELKRAGGQERIGFSDFWKLRQQFDKTVKWNQKAQTISSDELREMRRIFDDTLTEAVESGARPGIKLDFEGLDKDSLRPDSLKAASEGLDVESFAKSKHPPVIELDPDTTVPTLRNVTDGRHRLLAAQRAGAPDAPVVVRRYDAEGNLVSETTERVQLGSGPAEQAGGSLTDSWKAAKEDYHDFVTLKDAADELRLNREKNRWHSPTDYASGGLFGMGAMQALLASGGAALPSLLTSAAVGLVASTGHKFLRERGSAMIAKAADRLATVEGQLTRSARVLAGLEKAKRSATPVIMGGVKLQERFDKLAGDVQTMTSDPSKFTTKLATLTGEMEGEQPELAAAVRDRVTGDYTYLASQLPKPLGRGQSLTPNAIKMRYTDGEMRRWVAKASALNKPSELVEKLERGEIDRDGIEALKARRPHLFQELRVRVAEACAERDSELDPQSRVLLSLVFDITADSSMDPAVIRELQAGAKSAQPEEAPGPAPRSFDPKLPEGYSLPSQKVMGA
jgi:hypothetical protein